MVLKNKTARRKISWHLQTYAVMKVKIRLEMLKTLLNPKKSNHKNFVKELSLYWSLENEWNFRLYSFFRGAKTTKTDA